MENGNDSSTNFGTFQGNVDPLGGSGRDDAPSRGRVSGASFFQQTKKAILTPVGNIKRSVSKNFKFRGRRHNMMAMGGSFNNDNNDSHNGDMTHMKLMQNSAASFDFNFDHDELDKKETRDSDQDANDATNKSNNTSGGTEKNGFFDNFRAIRGQTMKSPPQPETKTSLGPFQKPESSPGSQTPVTEDDESDEDFVLGLNDKSATEITLDSSIQDISTASSLENADEPMNRRVLLRSKSSLMDVTQDQSVPPSTPVQSPRLRSSPRMRRSAYNKHSSVTRRGSTRRRSDKTGQVQQPQEPQRRRHRSPHKRSNPDSRSRSCEARVEGDDEQNNLASTSNNDKGCTTPSRAMRRKRHPKSSVNGSGAQSSTADHRRGLSRSGSSSSVGSSAVNSSAAGARPSQNRKGSGHRSRSISSDGRRRRQRQRSRTSSRTRATRSSSRSQAKTPRSRTKSPASNEHRGTETSTTRTRSRKSETVRSKSPTKSRRHNSSIPAPKSPGSLGIKGRRGGSLMRSHSLDPSRISSKSQQQDSKESQPPNGERRKMLLTQLFAEQEIPSNTLRTGSRSVCASQGSSRVQPNATNSLDDAVSVA